MNHLLLAAEIIGYTIAGLWAMAYGTAGIRRLVKGSDVYETVDVSFIAKYEARSANEGWAHRILVMFDILVNVIFRGQPDETISGRSYRASLEKKLWGRVMNYWLGLIEVQHGIKALIGDRQRAKNRIAINSKVLGIS